MRDASQAREGVDQAGESFRREPGAVFLDRRSQPAGPIIIVTLAVPKPSGLRTESSIINYCAGRGERIQTSPTAG